MNKFRNRLTLIFLLLTALSVLAFGYIVSGIYRGSQTDAMQNAMHREMALILSQMAWPGDAAGQTQIFASDAVKFGRLTGERVTFLNASGTVLGDSAGKAGRPPGAGASPASGLLSRPEIAQAKAEGFGTAVRGDPQAGHPVIYSAMPIRQQGQIVGYVRLAKSLEAVRQTGRRFWLILLASLIGLFAAIAIVSYTLARRISSQLEQATRVAKAIARLDYEERIDRLGQDEFGELGRALNAMADSLSQRMTRIQDEERRLKRVLEQLIMGVMLIDERDCLVLANRSAESMLGFRSEEFQGQGVQGLIQSTELHQLISDCKNNRATVREEIHLFYPDERIVEASLIPMDGESYTWTGMVLVLHDITAVRRLERMRSEFVANVSHELKTPVAAIKGFAETLMAGAMQDPETAQSFLKIIFDESDRLNRLIEDILELSKIESKRTELQFSPVHLPSFTEKMVEMMRSEAANKQIELSAQVIGDLYIEADEDRLQQIFFNLISNGIHYTPEGGGVKVKVEPVGSPNHYQHILLTVEDTGIGIPKKDIPRIFERFYRVDKARSRRSGGTGLGLSIVKHLVELHHGTIGVESRLGIGTKFTIELPAVHD